MEEKNKIQTQKGSAAALLPIGVFLVFFLGAGFISGDFYSMPAILAFLIALFVAFLQDRKHTFNEKIHMIAKGVGDDNIITMCLIFLAAGAFSRGCYSSGRSRFHCESGTFHSAIRGGGRGAFHHWLLHFRIYGYFHGNDRGAGAHRGGNRPEDRVFHGALRGRGDVRGDVWR